ncbi:sodium:solute symporter family protein [Pseudalkalibacillus berkeleyi]|uniref:Sodium:solute symporter family protein n=1 Tax=Pseudalkalibacillus berkeleyi TaxID=1069813 RepID=A0ABS9H0C3_9BACL|nr:sodium:solute symporter family protein [Pseudalkalibacillus berkeleyi]MCF6137521.1 sodium:solute symporter family protein [Pseudalkalibacillus berkeleyi]
MGTLPSYVLVIVGVLFLIYIGVLSWIGNKGKKHSRTMKGFATAEGKLAPWIVGASFSATFASANLYLGVPGLAYQYGLSVFWYILGAFGVAWIALLFLAKNFWRQHKKAGGVATLPEWLGKRYNSKSLQMIVSILLLFNIYYIVGQNVGMATIFEIITGIPYLWGIVIGVVITVFYIRLGGMFAQVITDGIQGILMSLTGVIVFASLFWTIGGGLSMFNRLENKLAAIDPNLTNAFSQGGPYGSVMALLTIQFLMIGFVLTPQLANKFLTLEKEEDLRPFTLSAGVHLFFITSLMVFGGLAARVISPNLSRMDQAIPVYLMESFPPIVVGLLMIGLLSAILSSTDGLYVTVTSSIGNDLIKPLLAKYSSLSTDGIDQKAVLGAKWSLFLVGLLSLYLSINPPDSLALLIQFSFSAIISGTFGSIILGYYWEKGNGYGAISSVITGSGSYIWFTGFQLIENIYIALFICSVIGIVTMIVVSYVTSMSRSQISYVTHTFK